MKWSWPILRPNQGSSWRKWGKQRKYQRQHPLPTRPQFTLSTAMLATANCPLQTERNGTKRNGFCRSSVEFFAVAILEYCDWLTDWVSDCLVSVCQQSTANEPVCGRSVRSSTGSSPANKSESRPCLHTSAHANTHTHTHTHTHTYIQRNECRRRTCLAHSCHASLNDGDTFWEMRR